MIGCTRCLGQRNCLTPRKKVLSLKNRNENYAGFPLFISADVSPRACEELTQRRVKIYDKQLPGRLRSFEFFAEDELASKRMSQDFWGWYGKLELRPHILPRVRRNPFMPKSRLLAFVIKELWEVLPPTVFFAVGFNLIVLTTHLILADYLVSFGSFMVAT